MSAATWGVAAPDPEHLMDPGVTEPSFNNPTALGAVELSNDYPTTAVGIVELNFNYATASSVAESSPEQNKDCISMALSAVELNIDDPTTALGTSATNTDYPTAPGAAEPSLDNPTLQSSAELKNDDPKTALGTAEPSPGFLTAPATVPRPYYPAPLCSTELNNDDPTMTLATAERSPDYPTAQGISEQNFQTAPNVAEPSPDYLTAPYIVDSHDLMPPGGMEPRPNYASSKKSPDNLMVSGTAKLSFNNSTAMSATKLSNDCPTTLCIAKPNIDCQTASSAAEPCHDYPTTASGVAEPKINNPTVLGTTDTTFNNPTPLSTAKLSPDYVLSQRVAEPCHDHPTTASDFAEPRINNLRAPGSTETSFDNPTALSTAELSPDYVLSQRVAEPCHDHPTTASDVAEPRINNLRAPGSTETSFNNPTALSTAELSPDYVLSPRVAEPCHDHPTTASDVAEPRINNLRAPGSTESSFGYPTVHDAAEPCSYSSSRALIAAERISDNLMTPDTTETSFYYPANSPEPEFYGFSVTIKTEPHDFEVLETTVDVERIKSEPEQLLYADHEIKEEIVIGPTEVGQFICERYSQPEPCSDTDSFEFDVERLYGCRVAVQNVDELQCRRCGEWSVSAAALQRHKQTHGQVSESQVQVGHSQGPSLDESTNCIHQCQQCNKVCKSNWHLLKHLATHQRVITTELQVLNQTNVMRIDKRSKKPYPCNVCGRRFKHNCNLSNHLKSHSLEAETSTLYECEQPHIGAAKMQPVVKIQPVAKIQPVVKIQPVAKIQPVVKIQPVAKIQPVVKIQPVAKIQPVVKIQPVAKIQCQKQKKVININKLLKPFPCDFCDQRFKYKCNLGNHVKCHTSRDTEKSTKVIKVNKLSLKPYPCDFCNQRFKYKCNLANHHVKVHIDAGKSLLRSEADRDSDSAAIRNKNETKETDNRIPTSPDIIESKEYQCTQCTDKFTSKMHLVEHQVTHIERNAITRQWHCDQCDKQFPTRARLLKHQITHSEKQFKCNICKNKFKYKFTLERHLKHHSDNDKINECQSETEKGGNSEVFENTKYQCNECNRKFMSNWHLVKHKASHSCGKMLFTCGQCDKYYQQSTSLIRHHAIHHSQIKITQFTCDICHEGFNTKNSLIDHLKIHYLETEKVDEDGVQNEPDNQIAVCPPRAQKEFNNKDSLIDHLKLHSFEAKKVDDAVQNEGDNKIVVSPQEEIKTKEYKCKLCSIICMSKWHLVKHEAFHSCEHCGKQFITIQSQYRHSLKKHPHNDVYNYPCKQCNKKFIYKSDFLMHQISHTNIKRFKCDICRKSFKYRFSLVRHLKEHNSEDEELREFHCDQCNKQYSTRQKLLTHYVSHSKVRRFTCDFCKKKFKHKFSLVKHLKTCVEADTDNDSAIIQPEKGEPKKVDKNVIRPKYWHLYSHKTTNYEMNPITQQFHCDQCNKQCSTRQKLLTHYVSHSKVRRFTCDFCKKKFKHKFSLVKHLKTCVEADTDNDSAIIQPEEEEPEKVDENIIRTKQFQCRQCGRNCMSKWHLIKHQRSHSDLTMTKLEHRKRPKLNKLSLKSYKCDICKKRFRNKSNLYHHKRNHADKNTYYECKQCGRECMSNWHLVKHRATHYERNPISQQFHCDQCDKQFQSAFYLSKHQASHGDISTLFTCDICQKYFNNKDSIIDHIKRHNLEADKVDDTFIQDVGATSIQDVDDTSIQNVDNTSIQEGDSQTPVCSKATDIKEYSCNQCAKKFWSHSHLVEHRRFHISAGIPAKTRKYTCDICERPFTYKCNLVKHIQGHTSEPNLPTEYECNQCSMKCKTNWHLVRHQSSHVQHKASLKLYPCGECAKQFRNRSNLNRHRRSTHGYTGVYTCKICHSKFNYKDSLIDHIKKHSLNTQNVDKIKATAGKKRTKFVKMRKLVSKPYPCHICEKRFNHKSNLSRHIKIHSEPKTTEYQCNECSRQFMSNWHLVKHQATHCRLLTSTIYPSRHCKKHFSTKSNLSKHSLKKHRHMIPCGRCEKTFRFKTDLLLHQITHNTIKRFKCKICQKSFKYRFGLIRHLKEHGLEADEVSDFSDIQPNGNETCETPEGIKTNKYECNQCSVQCKSDWHLTRHKATHSNHKKNPITQQFHCDRCYKRFPTRTRLLIHHDSHSDIRPFTCHICKIKFKHKSSLEKHLKTCLENDSAIIQPEEEEPDKIDGNIIRTKQFQCRQCGRNCMSKWHLIKHQRSHSDLTMTKLEHHKRAKLNKLSLKCYKCDICKKTFRNKSNLFHHKRSHADKTTYYECKQCGRECMSNWHLVKHRATHCERNPITQQFHCDECDKQFQSAFCLSRHQASHGDLSTLFTCDICKTEINKKDSLIEHIKKHERKIKHKCEKCNKMCKSNWHLLTHQTTHLGEIKDDKNDLIKSDEDEETDYQSPPPSPSPSSTTRKEHKCEKCNKICKTNWHLRKHQTTHLVETKDDKNDLIKSDEDEETDYQSPSPSSTTRKEHKCEKCNKICKTNWHLLKHQTTHLVETKDDKNDLIKSEEDEETDYHSPPPSPSPSSTPLNISPPRKEFQCEQCHKICSTNWHLIKHQSTHTGLKLFKCGICDERLKGKIEYQNHLKNHSVQFQKLNKSMLLASCETKPSVTEHDPMANHSSDVKFPSSSNVNVASTSYVEYTSSSDVKLTSSGVKHSSKLYSCNDCDLKFRFATNRSRHQALQHNERKQFICDICHQKFIYKDTLIGHLKKHSLTNALLKTILPNCEENLITQLDCELSSLKGSHKKLKMFTCAICKKRFKHKVSLRNHIMSHKSITKEKKPLIKPGDCGEIDQNQSLEDNNEYCDPTKENKFKEYQCELCHKSFKTKLLLAIHETNHITDKHFQCDICQKRFNFQANLTNHLKTHRLKIKHEYPCDRCDKVFRYRSKLYVHKTIHNKSKTHVCDICEKTFKFHSNLKSHMLNVHVLRAMRKGKTDKDPNCSLKELKFTHYRCDVCDMTFISKQQFIKHQEMHRRIKKFSCDICTLTFSYDTELATHRVRTHGRTDNLACDMCNKIFTRHHSLNKHLYSVHKNVKPYACDIKLCDKRFNTKNKLLIHQGTHDHRPQLGIPVRPLNPVSCDICHKTFGHKISLTRHKIVHSKARNYSCDICKKWFAYKNSVAKHMIMHMAVKPFACHICDKRFNFRTALNSHLVYHSGVKRFTCDICDKKYTDKSGLTKHIINRHNKKIDTFVCEVCNRSFSRKNDYSRHILVHGGVKTFTCHLCGQSFVHKCTFTKHLSTHNVNPFQCDSCGRKCKTGLDLRRHYLSIHSEFTCDICAQSFTLKETLAKHILTHNRFKQFPCDICEKKFRNKSDLTKHLLVHDTKPTETFTCGICNENFNDNNNLLSHVCHHETFEHVCEICGQNLKEKQDLEKHLLIHSDSQVETVSLAEETHSANVTTSDATI